jgi:hypothetical protein
LSKILRRQISFLHERLADPHLGKKIGQAEKKRAARHHAVVVGQEQPGHNEGHGPLKDLGNDPRNHDGGAAAHRALPKG